MSNKEPNLKIKYKKVAEELNKEFGYKTVMQIPRIEKVIVPHGIPVFLKEWQVELSMSPGWK